ncbi:MAG: MFS transporter [Dehalococcoidia bacterium]
MTEPKTGPLRVLGLSFDSLSSFNYPQYRLFWLGGLFSCIGMWSLVFGRLWLMHSLTPEEYMLGLVTACSLGPILFLSIWGGVLADRVNRRVLLIITRFIIAALCLLTAILITVGAMTPMLLLVISFVTGVLLAFDIPARAAMLPGLVPRPAIVNAIVLYSMAISGSAILGPGFFGILVDNFGIDSIFYLVAAAYGVVVLLFYVMSPTPRPQKTTSSPVSDLKQGLQYLKLNKGILGVILMGIFTGVFGMSFETLLPAFAKLVYVKDVSVYSNMLLSLGIGGMLSTVILAKFANTKNSMRIMLVTGVLFSLSIIAFGLNSSISIGYVLIGLTGSLSFAYLTVNSTIVQFSTDDRYRGRVMSIHQWTWGSTSVGGFLIGLTASYLNPQLAVAMFGFVTLVVITGFYFWSKSKLQTQGA